MHFLQHVTALLPVHYFGSIHLTYLGYGEDPPGCPLAAILEFLSIVPNGGAQQAAEPNRYTRYILEVYRTITVEALAAILAHPFHTSVKLAFELSPFTDDNVPFIEMLKDATHLCSVEFPEQLLGELDELISPDDALPVEYSVRLSNGLTICTPHHVWSSRSDSACGLLSIATMHDVEDIRITCGNTEQELRVLGYHIRPFLDGRLKTKKLRIKLIGKPRSLQEIKEWAAALKVSCESKDLTTFNVRLVPYAQYDSLPQNLDGVQQWDAEIFPSLVLNYYGEKLTQPLDDQELLLAIQLINEGFVYRQVTGHKPHDKSMANAGLIYSLMRIKAGETQDVGGGHGDQPSKP
jgi:hypothetical protein